MVNYAQLLQLDATNLTDTAKSVGTLGDNIDRHADTVRGKSYTDPLTFAGPDADAAATAILKQAPKLEQAGQALRHSQSILVGLIDALLGAKRQVLRAKAATVGTPLTISDDGIVSVPPGLSPGDIPGYTRLAGNIADMIDTAVKAANDADDDAVGKLKAIGTPEKVGDLGKDVDITDADRAADLLEKADKGKLSDSEADELTRLLAQNSGDKEFAEELKQQVVDRGIISKDAGGKDDEGGEDEPLWKKALMNELTIAEGEAEGETNRLGRPGMPNLANVDFSGLDARIDPKAMLGNMVDGMLPEKELFKFEAGDSFLDKSVKGENGIASGEAKVEANWEAKADSVLNKDGLSASAEARIGALAEANGELKDDFATISGTASAAAEATSSGNVELGKDGLTINGEAFAGGRITGETGHEAGGFGIKGTGEGWAGPGAAAEVTAGKNPDGTWGVGASAGLSPMLGGKVGFEVTVDPEKVTATANDFKEAGIDTIDSFSRDRPNDHNGVHMLWDILTGK